MGERLGATPVEGGTRFEVWAPVATAVGVFVESSRDVVALQPEGGAPGARTWVGVVDGVGPGDTYRLVLGGADSLPDPASRRQPQGVHGPSAVVDTDRFVWTDDTWTGVDLRDAVLYEVHLGTFTPDGTFDAAIAQLRRLADLGVTLVELMPVAAFPGVRNWGYDGVFPSAVQESYGGPDGLARFVDAAHAHGLGVVLDVVYNHFGPEGSVMQRFGPYLTDAYSTPWGEAVNVAGAGSDGVRRTFIESAVGWIDDYHVDGLRLDAVHAIHDPSPIPFVEELTAAVHAAAAASGRTALVTIESSANDPRIVRSTEIGGWGCDAVWNDDLHHTLRVALTGERHDYYAGYDGVGDLAAAFEHRWVYRGQYSSAFGRRHGAPADDVDPARMIVFAQNHDHNGNTPRGRRLLDDADPGDPRLRVAAAVVLLSPFTPMLFMGEEYRDTAPFPYFVDHSDADLIEAVRQGRRAEFADADWAGGVADPADPATYRSAVLDPSLAASGHHAALLAMYTELLRLRREVRVLTDPAACTSVWRHGDVIVVERSAAAQTVVLTVSFAASAAPGDVHDGAVGVDGDVLFDTNDPRWHATPSRTLRARLHTTQR